MRKKALNISVVLVILFGVAIFVLPSSPFRSRAGVTINIADPNKNYANNVKVNIHDHSNVSAGGAETPAVVGTWYKNDGYKGYSLSDEQKMTPNPNVAGISWLGLAEEQTVAGKELVHINGKTNQTGTNLQASVDAIKSQGGKSIAIHPNGTTATEPGWDNTSLTSVNNLLGMEIYNPKNGGIATSKWDYALSNGKKYWGFAFDDSKTAAERGKALIVVNTPSAAPSSSEILTQIYAGNFYATSRPTSTANFYDLKIARGGYYNLNITVTTTVGSKIRLVKSGTNGGTTIVTAGKSTTYQIKGDEKYVRAEVLDATGKAVAWSQPIYTSKTVTSAGGTTTGGSGDSGAGDQIAEDASLADDGTVPDEGTTETTEEFTTDETDLTTGTDEATTEQDEATTEKKTNVAGNKKFNVYLVIGTILLVLGAIGATLFFYFKRRGLHRSPATPPQAASLGIEPKGNLLESAQNRMESMEPTTLNPTPGNPASFNTIDSVNPAPVSPPPIVPMTPEPTVAPTPQDQNPIDTTFNPLTPAVQPQTINPDQQPIPPNFPDPNTQNPQL